MAGEIKRIIDSIISQRAKDNPILIDTTRAKLIFRGVNPDRFTDDSPSDPHVEAKLRAIALEMGISLR